MCAEIHSGKEWSLRNDPKALCISGHMGLYEMSDFTCEFGVNPTAAPVWIVVA
ncbi:hypothetical protein SAMN05421642_116102 [Rhodococcoides kyotonense]|uniref:Uncharacterized protein n=1 Tax=Rhodococcoides kyotonense TaxID=398843 RepID=A0A239M7M0_9NOCA|nr:hypothetical protein SAMN05421642_116102 [Rhodococcus kyotonensis]